jgi:aspartokinase-like uncharacterized kinase
MRGPLTVVKVGGSLLAEGRLRPVLRALAGWREARAVIVPGGGVFADAVRSAQGRLGFDDALAHRLALDAMGQMAAAFQACDPRLARLSDPSGIGACHATGRVPVWDPVLLKTGHPEIPEDWSVTSDSLGLWLACAIGARRVAILKSVDPAPGADPAALSRQGIVDGAFPAFAARFSGGIDILGPGRWGEMLPVLRGEGAGSDGTGPGSVGSRSTAA